MLNKILRGTHPFAIVTALLILANVAVYLAQIAAGLPWTATPEQQISWGGNLAALTLTGDYWRLLSSTFLHSGAIHLLLNMSLLVSVGPRAERQFGRLPMLVVYLAGGVLASLMSAWWLGRSAAGAINLYGLQGAPVVRMVVSTGASGAIMALCGALLTGAALDFWRADGRSSNEPGIGNSLAQVVGINLAMGLFVTGVDQAAHAGGLLGGAVIACMVGLVLQEHGARVRAARLIVSVVVVAGAVWGLLQAAGGRDDLLQLRKHLEQESKVEQKAEADAAAELKSAADAVRADAARKAAAQQQEKALPEVVDAALARGRSVKFGRSGISFALSGDENKVYALDHDANQFVVIDVKGGAVEKRIAGQQKGQGPTLDACASSYCGDFVPMDIVTLRGQPLALVTGMHQDAVTLIDTEVGSIVRTVKVGSKPHAIVLSPDQRRAYVHNTGGNSLSVIDIPTAAVIGTLVISTYQKWSPDKRMAMWFSADSSRLYAGNTNELQIEVIDTQALRILEKVIPHYSPRAYAMPQAVAGADVLGLATGGMVLLSPAADKVRRLWYFCSGMPVQVAAVGPQTAGAQWVAVLDNLQDGSRGTAPQPIVRIADLESHASVGRYPLSDRAVKMQFSADGKRLFAVSRDGVLSIIDPLQRLADQPLLCD